MEDSFETLHKDRVCAWLGIKKKGKEAGSAVRCPQFPFSRFNEVKAIWMTAAARRKAAWEAGLFRAESGSSNPLANDAEASGSGQGVDADDPQESHTGNGNGDAGEKDVIDISDDEVDV